MEAMACGLPVVATDVGGVCELIADGTNGRVVRPEDSGALADAIAGLLKSREQREALGRAARLEAEQRFGLDRSLDVHLRAFELALRHHAAKSRKS
jgi:glycosyltransferase involved in cell wall biosynthesis